MASNIRVDDTDFQNKISAWLSTVVNNQQKVTRDIATEILRRSQFIVPHDKGLLQNSGFVQDQVNESIVGYNKVYAARLHEHPEYRFQKGREGKYLENPIKAGLPDFKKYVEEIFGT